MPSSPKGADHRCSTGKISYLKPHHIGKWPVGNGLLETTLLIRIGTKRKKMERARRYIYMENPIDFYSNYVDLNKAHTMEE